MFTWRTIKISITYCINDLKYFCCKESCKVMVVMVVIKNRLPRKLINSHCRDSDIMYILQK